MKTTKGDPYSAALYIAQRLQILEDHRGTMRELLDTTIRICQQMLRSHDLSDDDKSTASSIIREAKRDIELLYSMGVFERMDDWRDVVASFRPDPFETIEEE